MTKEKYFELEMEVVKFDSEDVITYSCEGDVCWETPELCVPAE